MCIFLILRDVNLKEELPSGNFEKKLSKDQNDGLKLLVWGKFFHFRINRSKLSSVPGGVHFHKDDRDISEN